MAKKTKAAAAETRTRILAAATDVFFERGVAGASLNEIAERANVTRGAIYWHFKNKVDIFGALFDQLHQSVIEIILEDMEKEHPDPLAQLERLCIKLLVDVQENRQKNKILSIFFLKCDYSGEMEPFLEDQRLAKKQHIELFTQYFDRAIRNKKLSASAEPKILTLALSFYLTGVVFETLRDTKLLDLRRDAMALVSQFFAGIPQA